MSKRGDIFGNPATGESGCYLVGTDETNGKRMVVDLRVSPGGAVMGEHLHDEMYEKFTVIDGKLGYKLDGKEYIAQARDSFEAIPGHYHDWWNAGETEARVLVEFRTAARFELMMSTFFGLAQDGKTNKKGMPNMLQLAVINKEFPEVIKMKSPPAWAQDMLFSILAPIGRLLGYKAVYPKYILAQTETMEPEPLPDWVEY